MGCRNTAVRERMTFSRSSRDLIQRPPAKRRNAAIPAGSPSASIAPAGFVSPVRWSAPMMHCGWKSPICCDKRQAARRSTRRYLQTAQADAPGRPPGRLEGASILPERITPMIKADTIYKTAKALNVKAAIEIPRDVKHKIEDLRDKGDQSSLPLCAGQDPRKLRGRRSGPAPHVRRYRAAALLRQNRQRGGH